jgi:hypothetical protein
MNIILFLLDRLLDDIAWTADVNKNGRIIANCNIGGVFLNNKTSLSSQLLIIPDKFKME